MDCRGVSISLLNPKFAPFSPDSKTKQTKPKWFNTAAFRADTMLVGNYFLFRYFVCWGIFELVLFSRANTFSSPIVLPLPRL